MPKRVPEHVKEGIKKQAVKGEIRPPDLARLTACFFQVAGGERAVAKMLYEEFAAAGEGSVVRQRILDMILRATRFTTERMHSVEELGQLSDDDLERELNLVMEDLAEHLGASSGEEAGQEAGHKPDAAPDGAAGQEPGGPPAPARAAPAARPAGAGPDHPAGPGPGLG